MMQALAMKCPLFVVCDDRPGEIPERRGGAGPPSCTVEAARVWACSRHQSEEGEANKQRGQAPGRVHGARDPSPETSCSNLDATSGLDRKEVILWHLPLSKPRRTKTWV